MEIVIYGAHNIESEKTRTTCMIIDGSLVIDAGCLTSNLSFIDQMKLKAILLTHAHYDHVRDLPAIGMNYNIHGKSLNVYAISSVFDMLRSNLLNNGLYPDFFNQPVSHPSLQTNIVKPGEKISVAGYEVLPVTMPHSVPTTGFQITGKDGLSMLYTGDTGIDTPERWSNVHPDLLIIEVTARNDRREFAIESGHLTPELLQQELEKFMSLQGYLPRIITVHMNPLEEPVIRKELDAVSSHLGIAIETAYEGMHLSI